MIPADMDKDAMLMYAQITIDRLTDEKQALAKQLAESELASASALEASEEARSLAEQKVSALKRAGLLPVDSLPKIAAPVSQAAALTDEQITAIAQHAFANTDKLNDWSGFTKDEDGKYTVPFLTSKDIQLARVMLAAGASPVPAAPPELARIGELLRTQDNRYTEAPIFVVEQKTPIVSDADYNDCRVEWRESENGDYQLASPERAARLESLYRAGRDTDGWRRYEVTDVWEFVTACLTEQGCRDYLARNAHNLRETRIYAYGSYRNNEFRAVRNWLMSLATPAPVESSSTNPNKEAPTP